jgi:hypothetical protein
MLTHEHRRNKGQLLVGGPGDEAAGANRCWQERLRLPVAGTRTGFARSPGTPGPPTIRPFDDAERPDLTERVGYGSAGTPPGDFTSPTRETPRGARPKLFVRPR